MAYVCEMRDGVLRVTFSGIVTLPEVDQMLDEVEDVERQHDTSPPRIADLRAVEDLALDFAKVERVASRRRGVQHKNPVRSAIVASKPLHYGLARMYQTLNDNQLIEIRIFDQLQDAEGWVCESPSKAR